MTNGTRRGWGVSVTPRPLFTTGKDPVPIVQEAGWAQGRSGQVRKISPLPGFDPRSVQTVASRYTDYATRPTTLYTGSGRNTWRFGNTVVCRTVGVRNLSLSALLAKTKHFSCHGALVCRASGFCCGDIFQKQRFCLDSEDISSALQYSSERVSLVAILLLLKTSQEQGVRKQIKDNGGFETEVAAISPNMLQRVEQNFQKRLGENSDKGRHLTDSVFRKWML